MKNILTLILCFIGSFSFAQKQNDGLLWKIEGPDFQTSYLFGTMHVLCDATLSQEVEEALNVTQIVVLELDMDDPNLQVEMMKSMVLENGDKLSNYLSEEEKILVEAFLMEHIKMPLNMFDTLNPLVLESMLITAILDCPMQSIENNLMAHAKQEQEEVLGLETVSDQFAAFNAIPLKDQVQTLLKKVKKGIDSDKELFKKMQESYQKGSLEELMTIMNEDASDLMKNSESLLDNRNKNWIPRIKEYSKKRSAFYGVGAAHLAGENGVVQLLRNAGFKVTLVK